MCQWRPPTWGKEGRLALKSRHVMELGFKKTLGRWTHVFLSFEDVYLIPSISQVWESIVFMPNSSKEDSFTGMWVYFHQQHDKNTRVFPNESEGSFWKESDLEENFTREVKGLRRSVKIQKSNGPPASRNQRWGFQPEKGHTLHFCSLGTPEPEETCMQDCPIPNPLTVYPARERARNRGCWEKKRNERATSESQRISHPHLPQFRLYKGKTLTLNIIWSFDFYTSLTF